VDPRQRQLPGPHQRHMVRRRRQPDATVGWRAQPDRECHPLVWCPRIWVQHPLLHAAVWKLSLEAPDVAASSLARYEKQWAANWFGTFGDLRWSRSRYWRPECSGEATPNIGRHIGPKRRIPVQKLSRRKYFSPTHWLQDGIGKRSGAHRIAVRQWTRLSQHRIIDAMPMMTHEFLSAWSVCAAPGWARSPKNTTVGNDPIPSWWASDCRSRSPQSDRMRVLSTWSCAVWAASSKSLKIEPENIPTVRPLADRRRATIRWLSPIPRTLSNSWSSRRVSCRDSSPRYGRESRHGKDEWDARVAGPPPLRAIDFSLRLRSSRSCFPSGFQDGGRSDCFCRSVWRARDAGFRREASRCLTRANKVQSLRPLGGDVTRIAALEKPWFAARASFREHAFEFPSFEH